MRQRLQTINDDTVLEITEEKPMKRRFSQEALLRHKEYLEQSIAHLQRALTEVNARQRMLGGLSARRSQAVRQAASAFSGFWTIVSM
ncbi:hypothetical protein [Aquibium oceanicum]|uniref:hypothetical protein n=1 Tax=Aquibium oceanicum TaxID=1670800 RepID=UPI003616865A